MTRLRLVPTLVFATGLGAAACGGGGDNDGMPDAGNGGNDDGGGGAVRIDSIDPARGPLAGGTEITITGEGFSPSADDTMVVIGDGIATSVATVNQNTVTAVVPAGTDPVAVNVTVFNSGGFDTVVDGYTYNARPALNGVTPPGGPEAGGTAVTLTGTGFMDFGAGTNIVTFAGVEGTDVTVVSDTELTVTSPAGQPYTAADIQVVNANGASNAQPFLYHGVGLLVSTGPESAAAGALYFVNPTTGLTVRLGVVMLDGDRVSITGMETIGDTVYAVTGRGTIGQRLLITVDPFTLEATEIGPLTDVSCNDIAWDEANSILYCRNREDLYSIDPATSEVTFLGILMTPANPFPTGRGMAFEDDGTLRSAQNDLVTLDPVELTGSFDGGLGVPTDKGINAMANAGGVLYGTSFEFLGDGLNSHGKVFRIDTATPGVSEITLIEAPLDGIAATP